MGTFITLTTDFGLSDGYVHILHIDYFGNLITDIKQENLSITDQSATIMLDDFSIHGLTRTYAEGKGLIALFGSSDYLEISLVNGNAAAFCQSKIGDEIRITHGGQ